MSARSTCTIALILLSACSKLPEVQGAIDAAVSDGTVTSTLDASDATSTIMTDGGSPDGTTGLADGSVTPDGATSPDGSVVVVGDGGVTSWTAIIKASIPSAMPEPQNSGGEKLTCAGTLDITTGLGSGFHTYKFEQSAPIVDFSVNFYMDETVQNAGACTGLCSHLSFGGGPSETSLVAIYGDTVFSYMLEPVNRLTHVRSIIANATTRNAGMDMPHVLSTSPYTKEAFNTAQGIFGHEPVPNTGYLWTFGIDCNFSGGIANLTMRLIREDGRPLGLTDGDAWHDVLYQSNLFGTPEYRTDYTQGVGFMYAGNIPVANAVNGELYRVELWGRDAAARPKLYSCEQVRIFPDSFTLSSGYPLNTRSPSNCSDDGL